MHSGIRFYFILIIFLLLPFLILAGGSQDEIDPVLKVWDFKYNDTRTRRIFDKVDLLFLEANEGSSIIHKGFDDQEYVPALRAALLAGTAPDVIMLHQGTEFIEFQSYFETLDDFLSDSDLEFREASLDPCKNENGELKTFPLSFQGMGWYYNKELFKQAGLDPEKKPSNWEEFLNACKVLKENGITPIACGNNRPLTTDFIRRSLSAAFYTESEIKNFFQQGRGIASAEYKLIMEFCLELRKEGYLDPEGIFRPYFNYSPNSFSSGKCAMTIGLLSDIAHWQDFSNKLGKDNIGYFPNLIHPQMKNPGAQLLQNAGLIMGINKNSKNKVLAYNYLKNLYSDKSLNLLVGELGMLVPLKHLELPSKDFPVLADIEESFKRTGPDLEQYTSSTYIRESIYRYDSLLINTMEITIDDYIKRLYDNLRLF